MNLIDIAKYDLEPQVKAEVLKMLSTVDNSLDLRSLWLLMDEKWDYYNCDNRYYHQENYSRFYRDAIWTLNGLFIEEDLLSQRIRDSLAASSLRLKPKRILDWGGGLGSLARKIADLDQSISVDIYEPYPSSLAIKMCSSYENIRFVNSPESQYYDLVLCTDVLEHLPEPLRALNQISSCLKPNSHVIFANCFFPVIKCHLPSTFILRHSFPLVCRTSGLKYVERLSDSYSELFCKKSLPSPRLTQLFVLRLVQSTFPFVNVTQACILNLKKYIRNLFKSFSF